MEGKLEKHSIFNKLLKLIIVCSIFSLSGLSLFAKENPTNSSAAKRSFIVSGLFGGVICEENDLIYKKEIPNPCTIKTGKNSFLELKSDDGALIVVGPNSVARIGDSKVDLQGGSLRAIGDFNLELNGFGHRLQRKKGDQLFFSSEVFKELEFLSLKDEIIFFEEHTIDGVSKTGETKVPSGSWGNIGGRFGKTLGDFFELSEDQMTYFKAFLLPQSSSKERHE